MIHPSACRIYRSPCTASESFDPQNTGSGYDSRNRLCKYRKISVTICVHRQLHALFNAPHPRNCERQKAHGPSAAAPPSGWIRIRITTHRAVGRRTDCKRGPVHNNHTRCLSADRSRSSGTVRGRSRPRAAHAARGFQTERRRAGCRRQNDGPVRPPHLPKTGSGSLQWGAALRRVRKAHQCCGRFSSEAICCERRVLSMMPAIRSAPVP